MVIIILPINVCHVGLTWLSLIWLKFPETMASSSNTVSLHLEALYKSTLYFNHDFNTYFTCWFSPKLSPKSSTISFVISVPFREPTAQTSFVSLAIKEFTQAHCLEYAIKNGSSQFKSVKSYPFIRHTTPPLRLDRSSTKSRICFPVSLDHNLTVPSSDDVIINLPLYCNDVTAD